jgi:hypothetical protein
MKIYFAILKYNVKIHEVEEAMKKSGIEICNYYQKLNIVKLRSKVEILEEDFKIFFDSIEEEKNNFEN